MANPLHDNPRSEKPKAKEPEKATEEKPAAEKTGADDGEKKPDAPAEGMAEGDALLDELKALHKTHGSEIKDYFANHAEGARQMHKRHMKAMLDHFEKSRAKPAAVAEAGLDEVAAAAGDAAPAPEKE